MSVIVGDRDVLLQGGTRNVDPSAGKALLLVPDTNSFHVTAAGAGSPASILLRAQPLNIPGVATFSVTAGGALTGSGNSRSLALSDMIVASVTVTTQITYDGITYSASQIITKVQDGATGAAGDKTATAYLYQWAASAPAAPTGTSTFTWATGVNSAYSVADGWAVAVPANPGTPGLQLFTAAKSLTVASSITTSTVSYSGAAIAAVAMNGATGNTGAPGVRTAIARAYQWGLSAPTASGSATWTWATASYNTVPVTGWSATKPAAPSVGYTLYEVSVGMVDGTTATTSAINWSTGSVASIGYIGIDGAAGANAISAALSNDAHTVPTAADGTGGVFTGCASTMTVYSGATDDSAAWTVAATPLTGVTGSLSGKTYTVTAMSVDAGYVDLVASQSGYASITCRFTITKSKGGVAGVAATAYWLVTPAAIQKSIAGTYTPSAVTVSSYSVTGAGAPALYAGRFVIASTTDGTSYVDQYTSASNESSKNYTPAAGIKGLRVRAYLAGGTTTLLDEQLVAVVADGATGGTGATGAGARICYTLADVFTLSLSPATFSATSTNKPTTGTWGETRAWVDQPTTATTAGQAWFQSNGIYDGTNTVWGVPYLTNLKVGSLSALSANLGSINAGSIHGANVHSGNFSSWSWPATTGDTGFYLGPEGLKLGNYGDAKYFQVEASGNIYAPGLSIVDGNLALSGAVNASTITGSTVNGGTINGSTINGTTINASTLAAGTVAAGNLSSLNATIGTLRTASTGGRTEIKDNVIKVYDASNVLRVKLGDLSL